MFSIKFLLITSSKFCLQPFDPLCVLFFKTNKVSNNGISLQFSKTRPVKVFHLLNYFIRFPKLKRGCFFSVFQNWLLCYFP
jgi:hypothetical protein